jgi:hypothetical protein
MFYLGSLALFGLSATLIREASPFSRLGCFAYEKKRKLKLVGQILLVVATLALGIGVLSQFVSGHS